MAKAKNALRTRKPKRREPIAVLIGEHGVGKSTFGAESPDPIFIATEDGISNIEDDDGELIKTVEVDGMAPEDSVVRTWPMFLDSLSAVLSSDHKHKTLVIDTINGATSLLAHFVCKHRYGGQWAAVKNKDSFMAFGQGWKTCAEEVKQALRLIERINSERGMMVLLTAHVGHHSIKNPRLGDYQRIEGDIEKPIWQVISNWADLIMLADYEITVMEKERKAYSTNVRLLRCGGSVAEDTKCRAGFEIPEVMPFSFDGFFDALKNTKDNALGQVLELWPDLDPERQAAALSWLGVADTKKLAGIPVHKIRILLNSMVDALGVTEDDTEAEEPSPTTE